MIFFKNFELWILLALLYDAKYVHLCKAKFIKIYRQRSSGYENTVETGKLSRRILTPEEVSHERL